MEGSLREQQDAKIDKKHGGYGKIEWECKVGSGISIFCVSICTFVLVKHVGTKAAAGGMTFSVRASASVFVRSC